MSPRVPRRRGGRGDLVAEIARQAASIQLIIDKIDLRLDSLLADVRELQAAGGTVPPLAPAERSAAAREAALIAAARHGVSAVFLARHHLGATLHLNAASIELSAGLADLAEVLLADPGGDDGPLIGWKPTADVQEALAKRRGRPLTPGAWRMLVFQLRKRLGAAGENPHLVQVVKFKGARFARRRSAGAAAGRSADS